MTTLEHLTGQVGSDAPGSPAGGALNSLDDHGTPAAQSGRVVEGSNFCTDQSRAATHMRSVGAEPSPLDSHVSTGPQDGRAVEGPNIRSDQRSSAAPVACVVAEQSPHPASADATAMVGSPSGAQAGSSDQRVSDIQCRIVATAVYSPPAPASAVSATMAEAPVLADPLLALAADVLDDLEKVRIANENRLRQLTRTETDADGEERGFGLPEAHPDVARLKGLVEGLAKLEHDAELNLKRQLRVHALGPWVKQTRGVGEKQAARLLAAIGDPYWNDLHDRPRLVSELWSYCGYGDAAKQVRRRGEKANWSSTAKMRAYLVSVSIVKAGGPLRAVYDEAREKYEDAVHVAECRRCGPSGKPALAGSPLSAGHQHARALRAVSKEVLRALWLEAKRFHELHDGQVWGDTHRPTAVVDPTSVI